jgi:hypothetical protein
MPMKVMKEETLSISYELVPEDYIASSIYQYRQQLSHGWVWWALSIGLILWIILRIGFIVFPLKDAHPQNPSDVEMVITISLAFLSVLFSPWFRCWAIKKTTLNLVSKNSSEYLGPISLSIKPTGITTLQNSLETNRPWKNVKEIEVVNGYVFFVSQNLLFYRVPARAFTTQREFDEFVASAKKHMNAAVAKEQIQSPAG